MELCPYCASENIFFSKKRNSYFCEDCEKSFDQPSSSKGMRTFLSYGHDKNRKVVSQIKDYLNQKGYDVWIDTSEIPAGKDWRERITSGLIGSNSVISFLSKHSVRDPGVCLDELKIAVCIKRAYIKTVLLESEAEATPPNILRNTQWLDMSDWDSVPADNWDAYFEEKMELLLESLNSDDAKRYNAELESLSREMKVFDNTAKEQRLLKQTFVGRKWLTEKVSEWFASPSQDPFLICGVPGSGKSSFVANLTQFNPDVLAAVYFQWDYKELHDADTVIKLLALKLAAGLPDYRRMLCGLYQNSQERAKLRNYKGSSLFDCIILTPLQCCVDGDRGKGLIIFDGLDETAPEVANLLIRKAAQLPPWLKVLFTSRYDAAVTSRIQQSNVVMLDQSHEQNNRDIAEYLSYRLDLPETHDAVRHLAQKSEGSFMYAAAFCDAVDSGSMTIEDNKTIPFGLNSFFYTLFTRVFPDGKQYAKFRSFFELLCIEEDIPEEVICGCLGLDRYELWELRLTVKSLIASTESTCGLEHFHIFKTIRFAHQSIKDWLTDANLAGEYYVDISRGYRCLAEYYEKSETMEYLPRVTLFDHIVDQISPDAYAQVFSKEAIESGMIEKIKKVNHHNALKDYLIEQHLRWMILGGLCDKAEKILLDSFDAETMRKNVRPMEYRDYDQLFSLWKWADLFPQAYPLDDLVVKLTEIALFPRRYIVSWFGHRSYQIVLRIFSRIMDSGRYKAAFYELIRDFPFASYFTSRASDDGETRDGWDKYYMGRDAAVSIKKLEKTGICVPQDVKNACERMKLTYNCVKGDPNAGMFCGDSADMWSYGILSERALFKDLCILSDEETLTDFDKSCLTHYNTTSLRYYLANSEEEDMGFIKRSTRHCADLSAACKNAVADIQKKLERGISMPNAEHRLTFIHSLEQQEL